MDPRIILAKLNGLWQRSVIGSWPIGPWEARTADHLAPGEYRYDGDWATIDGDSLWPATKTLFLRAEAEAPEAPDGDLYIAWSGELLEGLLSIDGRPYAGIDANHLRTVVPAGRTLRLEAEFMCVPRALCEPALRAERARLRGVSFVRVDREVEAAYYDLRFAAEAARETHDERRRQFLDAAIEDALLAIDLTAPPERFRREVTEARRILAEGIGAIAPDPEAGSILLTGHSHIDTAWLWPLRETVRKCGRTFSTACRLMERYPDYRFSCSQPALYLYAREHYPALYEEIKGWVRTGRWECTGGMWVEPDCNVPSGEALIRQILHGVRFFQEEFGKRPRTCWLPDVFGYPASLPGILKGCGLDYFYTNKLHWQSRNPFPAHLFWWEGVDGSRVLAHIPRLQRYYNGSPSPEELVAAWDNVRRKSDYGTILLPFGFGDGGGGPTEEMLEFAARAAEFPGLPASAQGTEETFYDRVVADGPDLPTWVGELYLETHRGTYTTQAPTKRANRKNELALRDAEILGVRAQILGADLDISPLRGAWENLLLLQFHDILPGSSIGQVYAEAAKD
ncbi:MAG: alpha-mannosidase, partial [Chloroflexi bacterium]|nr:alpha-mannosidase [Chloroflexota bacterium]